MTEKTVKYCMHVNFSDPLTADDVISLVATITRLTLLNIKWNPPTENDKLKNIYSFEFTTEIHPSELNLINTIHTIVVSWCAGKGINCRTTERL